MIRYLNITYEYGRPESRFVIEDGNLVFGRRIIGKNIKEKDIVPKILNYSEKVLKKTIDRIEDEDGTILFDPIKKPYINEELNDKIYYHGSNVKFDKFDKSKIKENKLRRAFNFTDDKWIAYEYGDNIIAAHLDLNNPLTLDIWDEELPYEWFNKFAKLFTGEDDYEYSTGDYKKHPYTIGKFYNTYGDKPEAIEILEQMGYDGIALPEEHQYGVWEPEQIHIIQNENKEERNKMDKLLEDVISMEDAINNQFMKNVEKFSNLLLDHAKKVNPENPYEYVITTLENMSHWNKKDWEAVFKCELNFNQIRQAQVFFEKYVKQIKLILGDYDNLTNESYEGIKRLNEEIERLLNE